MKFFSLNIFSLSLLTLICSFSVTTQPVFAQLFDGGMLDGQEAQCSCTGGQTIRVQSYVDQSEHVYLYQPGVSQLYMNYNVQSAGNYFKATLVPFAICLDASYECEGSSGQQPEGVFTQIGTSFNPNTVLALVDSFSFERLGNFKPFLWW